MYGDRDAAMLEEPDLLYSAFYTEQLPSRKEPKPMYVKLTSPSPPSLPPALEKTISPTVALRRTSGQGQITKV